MLCSQMIASENLSLSGLPIPHLAIPQLSLSVPSARLRSTGVVKEPSDRLSVHSQVSADNVSVTPLESVLTQNSLASPLESVLTKKWRGMGDANPNWLRDTRLFAAFAKVMLFVLSKIQLLFAKHRGMGYRSALLSTLGLRFLTSILALPIFLLLASRFAEAQQVPEIPFDSAPDFLKLPPDLYLGEVAGVAVNSKAHIFVFSRGSTTGPAYGGAAAQLLEFDADGRFLREIGHHLYAWSFAHSVKVDKEDNVWVADKGSDMVIKFRPHARIALVFGRKQEASDEGTEPLRHPKPPYPRVDGKFILVSDIAWVSAGNA